MVWNVRPLVSKDATLRHIHHAASIVGLRAHVEDGHYHADEDEPERAINASTNSDIDRKANMIERCTSGVEEDDYTAETGPDEGCDDDCLPGKTNGVQA